MRATRAWLVACAALALACAPLPRVAAAAQRDRRLDHIKHLILAKLGLTTRPTPLGAPPRDVVRQILARAADPRPEPPPRHTENSMREVIAIAHRGNFILGVDIDCMNIGITKTLYNMKLMWLGLFHGTHV